MKCVIFKCGRSGSSTISVSLYPNENRYKEIFNRKIQPGRHDQEFIRKKFGVEPIKGVYTQKQAKSIFDVEYLQHVLAIRNCVVLMPHQCKDSVLDYLKRQDFKLLFLKRRNLIAQYISLLLAKRNRLYRVCHEEDIEFDLSPVHVDIEKLTDFIHSVKHDTDRLFSFFGESLRNEYYEDIFSNWFFHMSEIKKWIGLDCEIRRPFTKKLRTCKLRDAIKNFRELKDHFKDEAQMLEWLNEE